MNTAWARRSLLALGLALTVLVTVPGTASASFSGRATGTTTVGTATIAAPSGLTTTGSTSCGFGVLNYTVRVNWTASASARVATYTVVETVNGVARTAVVQPATQLSFTRATSRNALQAAPTHGFAISATTTYGWTSPVPATVSYTC